MVGLRPGRLPALDLEDAQLSSPPKSQRSSRAPSRERISTAGTPERGMAALDAPRQGAGRTRRSRKEAASPGGSDDGASPVRHRRRASTLQTDGHSAISPTQSARTHQGRRGSRARMNDEVDRSLESPKKSLQFRREGSSADVHIIGSVVGCSGFSGSCMYARWTFKFEEAWGWIHQAGLTQGTTQPSQPYEDNNDFSVWEHPIDIHFKTTTLQKWPQLVVKIFHRSVYVQRDEFCAYAVCSLPTHAGHHQISCSAWQPMDERCALSEELGGLWTGLYPQCVNDAPKEIVERPGWEYSSVQTKGVGRVHFRLFVVTKGMEDLSAVAQATRGLTTEKGSDEQGRMSYREVSLSTHQEEARNSPERSSVRMSRASRLRQTSMASSAGSDGGMRTNTASRQSSRDGSFHGDSVATGIRTAAADSTPPRRHRRGRSMDVTSDPEMLAADGGIQSQQRSIADGPGTLPGPAGTRLRQRYGK